jgi:hypothetical protein
MHVHEVGPALVQHLTQFFPVDRLIHGLAHFFLGPRDILVQRARRPEIAPALLVLRAEVEATKVDLHLLRRAPAAHELIALGDQLVTEVLVDLSQVRFTG